MDMSKLNDPPRLLCCPKCNNEFPAQGRERMQLILDTVRANQDNVRTLLYMLSEPEDIFVAKNILADMHKSDRDAILQPNGILTDEQIELLK